MTCDVGLACFDFCHANLFIKHLTFGFASKDIIYKLGKYSLSSVNVCLQSSNPLYFSHHLSQFERKLFWIF